VSNAGTLQAPQSLVITSAGKIENTGTIQNTNPQDSLLSISTGEGADIVSSGAMLTNGNLFLESGQHITLDKARLEKIGADNQNIISVSARGDVNLQNSTNIQNFGEGGDLYIDASNINLGNDINLGVNGSIVLDAQQNLKADSVRNISSTNDINLSAGDLLSLNNTPLWANLGAINLSATKVGSSIALNSTRLNAEKDVSIYGAGTVSINNLGLDKAGETTKTKNFNVNAQGDLTWQKAGSSLPIFTGKLDLRSNGKLDISGSQYITNDGINLVGKELIVDSQLKSNQEINLTASENDLNLNLGTELSAGSDINVSALKGNLNSYDLKAKSETGQVSLIAYGNTNLNKNKPFIIFPDIPGIPSTLGVASDAIVIEAKNGVVIGTTGTGNTTIESAKINSTESGIKIRSEGGANINDTSLNAKGNIEFFAKNDLMLKGLSSNSQSHTALHSDKNIVLDTSTNNAWVTKDLSYIPSGSLDSTSTQYSQLNSLGVLSLTSNLDQNISNSNLVGGAVLIESGGALNVAQSAALKPRQTFVINATGSDLLKNDANLQKINGNLSINTKSDLVLNAIDNSGRSFESKEVKPIFSSTGLMEIKTEGNLTLNGKTPPVNNNKLQQLMVDPAALKSAGGINLNASSIHLNSASLINSSAEKAVNLISTTGNITVNALNQNEVNQSQYDLLNPIQNRRDELIASGKTDNTTQNLIESLNKEVEFYLADLNGSRHIGSTINSDSDINITSKSGVLLRSADIQSKGNINIEAQGLLDRALTATNPEDQIDAAIVIDGTVDLFKRGLETDPNYMERSLVNSTAISADKDINITSSGNSGEILWTDNPQLSGDYTQAELQPIQLKKVINNAKDNIVINAADLISKGNINIKSNGNIVMESGVEEAYDKSTTMHVKESWAGLKRKSKITWEQKQLATAIPTILTANNINLQARGDIELYSTLMAANGGKVDIAGENLYFFTSKELDKYNSDSKSTSTLLGIKYDTTKINSNRTSVSQLPVRLQGDYLSTDSNQDTVFVGTQFDYLKDATIKANGDIALLGASNIIEESKTLEKNSVVWQKMEGEGSTTQTMTLPSFNGPTAPVFNAEGGLIVQVPISEQDQNKVQIKDEIVKLSNQPGYEYLKEFTQRNDVDWNRVILAQNDWDYKSQGLTGAGAAIIVIIVTVLTSGAGSAAASSIAGSTSAAVGAGAQAAITTLASQASVSLINNGGDIGKTLKDLGSKESVKGLVASVVTAGLLNQVGTTLGLKPDSTLLSDRLINNFTNSVGSTLVQTAVNGGDLETNLKTALLAGLAGALQGELAQQIKGLEGNYVLHKIAHAAAGCVAGALQKSCESGAIGAAIGEIVAGAIQSNKPVDQMTDDERIEYGKKVLGLSQLLAGTVSAYAGYDVNIAANAANVAVSNNYLTSKQVVELDKDIRDCSGDSNCLNQVDDKYFGKNGYFAINQEAYLNCKTLDCKLEHETARQAGILTKKNTPFVDYNLQTKFINRQDSSAIGLLKNANSDTAFIQSASKVLAFIDVNCGGTIDTTCNTKWQNYQEKQKSDIVLLMGMVASVGGGVVTTAAIRSCLANTAACNVSFRVAIDSLFTDGAIYGPGAAGVTLAARNQMLKEADQLKGLYTKVVLKQDYKPLNVSLCGSTACFVAGTLVETDKGLKPIEQLKSGDFVWSRNDSNFEYNYQAIIGTKRTENQIIHKIVIKNDENIEDTIFTTEEHPFWIQNKGWLKAALLQPGMKLLDRDDGVLEVIYHEKLVHMDTVYNIEVEATHTYHVGRMGVWVHNACCEIKDGKYVFNNLLPERLADEMADATRLGVKPMSISDNGFAAIVANDGHLKYAVTEDGYLLFIPKYVDGVEIKHAVITSGKPVLTAGEVQIASDGKGGFIAFDLDQNSGHFLNTATKLENQVVKAVAEAAFKNNNIKIY